MATIKRKAAKTGTDDRRYSQIHVDPTLHDAIRTEAKRYGLTTGGFVAWTIRTWKNADAESKSLALSIQPKS
jgi:hypothetical protein